MTKAEIVGYLASLLAIIESKEDAGRSRGGTLAREYERYYSILIDTIKKDEENARQSEQQHDGLNEDRAEDDSDQPQRG